MIQEAHGHVLVLIAGTIHDKVWECEDCGVVRTQTKYFKDVECN